ncbi:MAG TPA: hypothetical protein VFI61_02335 [Patescibacteria group bacterium]|nr:hypothetical protein [Patescibacteria group bacterium]
MLNNDATVVYYTSNKEDEQFESKIRAKLLTTIGDMPLISVSQKPLPGFGINICVGEKPHCDATAFRQLLMGLNEVKTKFAIAAESDTLYPPNYFTFTPPTDNNVYRYSNVWLLYKEVGYNSKGKYWNHRFMEGAQMCGRDYWIQKLEEALKNIDGWQQIKPPVVFSTLDTYSWGSGIPVVTCKTREGLRRYANAKFTSESIDVLPYWGRADAIRKELFDI